MKVLFISHTTQGGGAARSIMYGLKECQNYLLLVPNEGQILELYDEEKINYQILKIPVLFYSQYSKLSIRSIIRFLYSLPNLFKLKKIIDSGYTIIHLNEIIYAPVAYILKLFYKNKIKVVVHARVTMPIYRLGFSRTLFRHMLSKVDYIIAIGKAEYENLPEKVNKTILMNPVDHGNYKPSYTKTNYLHNHYNISKDFKIIGVFAQIHKGKGQDFILNSCLKFTENIKFKIIFFGKGSNSYIDSLNSIIQGTNHEKNIIFAGYVNNLYECMEGCDFLIRAEDFGLLGRDIMEANSLGVPVLTSLDKSQDYSSIILDQGNAIVFTPNDETDFINKLDLILKTYQTMRGWSIKNHFGFLSSQEYCYNLKKIWFGFMVTSDM